MNMLHKIIALFSLDLSLDSSKKSYLDVKYLHKALPIDLICIFLGLLSLILVPTNYVQYLKLILGCALIIRYGSSIIKISNFYLYKLAQKDISISLEENSKNIKSLSYSPLLYKINTSAMVWYSVFILILMHSIYSLTNFNMYYYILTSISAYLLLLYYANSSFKLKCSVLLIVIIAYLSLSVQLSYIYLISSTVILCFNIVYFRLTKVCLLFLNKISMQGLIMLNIILLNYFSILN